MYEGCIGIEDITDSVSDIFFLCEWNELTGEKGNEKCWLESQHFASTEGFLVITNRLVLARKCCIFCITRDYTPVTCDRLLERRIHFLYFLYFCEGLFVFSDYKIWSISRLQEIEGWSIHIQVLIWERNDWKIAFFFIRRVDRFESGRRVYRSCIARASFYRNIAWVTRKGYIFYGRSDERERKVRRTNLRAFAHRIRILSFHSDISFRFRIIHEESYEFPLKTRRVIVIEELSIIRTTQYTTRKYHIDKYSSSRTSIDELIFSDNCSFWETIVFTDCLPFTIHSFDHSSVEWRIRSRNIRECLC